MPTSRNSTRHPNSARSSSTRPSSPRSGSPRSGSSRGNSTRQSSSRNDSQRSSRRNSASTAPTFGSCTNIGCVRPQNEDSLLAAAPLFVVADGMGGHAAGEVASEIAIRTLADRAPKHPDATALGKVIEAANHAIIRAAREGYGREGMGTTCTAALLEGERLVIAQVGDSRAYLMHQGRLQQITRDHSLMADMIEAGEITPEQARSHPKRSVITRALGSDPRTTPDLYEINVAAGDRLLLCTDGLSGMLRDVDIERILSSVRNPQQCAQTLVDAALDAGGHDNVTVIVADVTGFAAIREQKLANKTKITVAAIALAFVLVLGGSSFAFNSWVNSSAYLGEHEGNVAVYQGFPGTLFGHEFSTLAYTTTIDINDLQPGTANRLRDGGIQANDMKGALALVESYAMDLDTTLDEVLVAVPDGNAPESSESPESGSSAENTGNGSADEPADVSSSESGDVA